MSSRHGGRPKAITSSDSSVRTHKTTVMLSVDPQDDFWKSRTYRASPKKQLGVEERCYGGSGRSTSSRYGMCAESGSFCGSGQSVSRNLGRHGNHKKPKSVYFNRKSMPVASPEADDEDEDYHSNRNHRILEKYYQKNSKPTVGITPSRIQRDYRKGVSYASIVSVVSAVCVCVLFF